MADRLTDSATDDSPSLVDDTGRRIMTARFIADEILRGAKRVSMKAAKALADGFSARDRQAAASMSELHARRAADLTVEERTALSDLREELHANSLEWEGGQADIVAVLDKLLAAQEVGRG